VSIQLPSRISFCGFRFTLTAIQSLRTKIPQKIASKRSGNRRGSSIFAASAVAANAAEEGDASGPYGRPAYLYGTPDDNLLEDFPERSQSGARIVNSDDMHGGESQSQYGSSEYGAAATAAYVHGTPQGYAQYASGNPKAKRGEAARMEELANSQDLPGGSNHRPLVGGFAAAAYEAAKAHHYSMKRKSDADGDKPKDGPPPPSI
jgi:hypothetical protein